MVSIAAEGVFYHLGDGAQGAGDIFSLSPFLFDVDCLRRLGCYGFLDIRAQFFCLDCLYRQVGGSGFGFGLGALGGLHRIAQFLVQ